MRTINGHKVALQAHRGVSTDCPENTMAAFRASVEQGYDWIELDPKFTADNQCVVLHDRTINRTGRDRNGQPVEEKTAIIDLTLAQAVAVDGAATAHGDHDHVSSAAGKTVFNVCACPLLRCMVVGISRRACAAGEK